MNWKRGKINGLDLFIKVNHNIDSNNNWLGNEIYKQRVYLRYEILGRQSLV